MQSLCQNSALYIYDNKIFFFRKKKEKRKKKEDILKKASKWVQHATVIS
jgi:hypothetical protein